MTNQDVYTMITDKIIEKLKAGEIPWEKPWNAYGVPKNFITKKEYRGINMWLLNQDYQCPYWITFLQCKDLKGSVNKGEKSSIIIKALHKEIETDKLDDNDEPIKKNILCLHYYRVFNLEQTTLIDQWQPEEKRVFNPVDAAERIINDYKSCPIIKYGGNRAYYNPVVDNIGMPLKESFKSDHGYYSTLFHELTHSTGHESRLNRKEVVCHSFFGDNEYSKEELTAELGASYLCALSDIKRTIDNSIAYIQSWLKALNNDKRMLIQASSKAQAAVDYITS